MTMQTQKPHSLVELADSRAAEAALLGSMILDAQVIPEVADVEESMFAIPEHCVLVRLIRQVYERHHGQTMDGLLVRNELESSGQLESIGGLEYLRQIVDTVPGAANALYYARIVRAKALRREALMVAREITEAAVSTPADDEREILEAVTEPMSKLQAHYVTGPRHPDMKSLLYEAYNRLEKPLACRIACPWHSLSRHIAGFKPGQMVVIAGRPGMGKTAFVLNLVSQACADSDAHVLFVSFEMDRLELTGRLISAGSRVPYWKFERAERDLSRKDYEDIIASLPVLSDYRMEICDYLKPTPLAIKNLCRAVHHKEPLDAIVVDYLQRIHTEQKRSTRDWEIGVISNELKNLARELHVPVFVVSQLNRDVEKRDNRRPRASDLRDSGTIEQDADVILGLYREDEYSRDNSDYTPNNLAEVLVLKQRNGPSHETAYLQFWPGTMTFYNRAADEVDGE